jgi:hypothetical protein
VAAQITDHSMPWSVEDNTCRPTVTGRASTVKLTLSTAGSALKRLLTARALGLLARLMATGLRAVDQPVSRSRCCSRTFEIQPIFESLRPSAECDEHRAGINEGGAKRPASY